MNKKLIVFLSIFISLFAFTFKSDQSVPEKPEDISPLLVGEKVPDISLKDIEGNEISLRKLFRKKKTILIFYRGSWCPFCNRHLAAVGKAKKDLEKMGYQIVAVSPDAPKFLKKTFDKNDLDYTLLSDASTEAMKQFGIAFQLDNKTIKKYKKYGINLSKQSEGSNSSNILPVPSLFIINKKGEILFEHINPNYKKRIKEQLLLAVAKSL